MIDEYELVWWIELRILSRLWQDDGSVFASELKKNPQDALGKEPALEDLSSLSIEFLWEKADEFIVTLPVPIEKLGALRFPLLSQPSDPSYLALHIQRKNWERSFLRKLSRVYAQFEEDLKDSPREVVQKVMGSDVPEVLDIRFHQSKRNTIVIPSLPFLGKGKNLEELEQASGWQFSTCKLWTFQVMGGNLNTTEVNCV